MTSKDAFVTCPTCGSPVGVYVADEGTSSYEPVKLTCSSCFRAAPEPMNTCECGNSTFTGTLTIRG